MYLKLKITGARLMHGRLPGEEFYALAGDNGLPINALWSKRLAEERQHHGGYVSILEQVDQLPNGATAIDGPAPQLAPTQAPTPVANADETRILEAVARALAGIRAEMTRGLAAAGQAAGDTSKIVETVKAEIQKGIEQCVAMMGHERMQANLIADAWRLRMRMPPNWRPGTEIPGGVDVILQAYADTHFNGDAGAAAMAVTEDDMQWQQAEAERMRITLHAA